MKKVHHQLILIINDVIFYNQGINYDKSRQHLRVDGFSRKYCR